MGLWGCRCDSEGGTRRIKQFRMHSERKQPLYKHQSTSIISTDVLVQVHGEVGTIYSSALLNNDACLRRLDDTESKPMGISICRADPDIQAF